MTTRLHTIAARLIALLEHKAHERGAPVDVFATAYTENVYREAITGTALSYWREGSRGNFFTRMNMHIKFGLNDAWNAAAASLGIDPTEYSEADAAEIARIVDTEKSFVGGLLDYLDLLANTPGASLQTAMPRLKMWGNRWSTVYNEALVWFGAKVRLQWVLGQAEHCVTCAALAGIVAWAQEWDQAGIYPGSHDLECKGFNCQCRLVQTTRRRSPKALDRIMRALSL